ncbi:unnamed protein product [Musa hybrid cultivar]
MDLKTLSLKDLIEGQESATQLHTILQDILPLLKSGSASTAATLMTRILSSFSRPISLLEVQGMVEGLPNTRVSDERRLDASSDKRKLHQPGKSGYRRRAHPCTNTRVVSETMDDGHVWRKYGQKNICTSKFPRSLYYRCGHKYDRGCQATRQVQRSEEDPSMFVITYMGQHACVGGSTSPSPPSPCVISFGSNAVQEKSFPSPIPSRDEELPNDSTPWTSPTELIFPDFPIYFDSVSTATSGCHASADSLNLEFNPEALEFGGVFCFGQGEPLHQI